MTSYETCLSKYTTYLRVKKFERSEALMKQGKTIFKRPDCTHQFSFNQGLLCMAQKKYDDAVERYQALYEDVSHNFEVRPSALRIEGNNKEEERKFAILNNLIIAYMMREMQGPKRAAQNELYNLLR